MKLVLHLSQMNWDVPAEKLGPLLAEVASMVEDAGFDGIAVADHLWQHPMAGGPVANSMEAYTTLAFLAAHTSSVRLFTLATGAHFRKPGLLAKTVTTLDVLSGGRAWLGIGAGHYAEECEGLGVPFPPTRKRYELLEDALEVCTRMWEGDHGADVAYTGHHVSASRLLNVPQVVRRPPILIAGTGERRTLPLVARYADACSLRPGPEIPHWLDVIRRACDDEGRDFDRIERTCAFGFGPDDGGPATNELLQQLEWMAGLGIETVIGRIDGDDPRVTVDRMARHVVSRASHIETAR